MSDQVSMSSVVFENRCVAIVQFGPATSTSGFRPAEYYQVTIDPQMVSKSGDYIRFGKYKGDEIIGWQRVDALTVCEILCDWPKEGDPQIPMTEGKVEIRSIE